MVEHWFVLPPHETIGLKVSGVGLGDALQHLDLKLPNVGIHSLKPTYLKIDGCLLEDYLPFRGKRPIFSGYEGNISNINPNDLFHQFTNDFQIKGSHPTTSLSRCSFGHRQSVQREGFFSQMGTSPRKISDGVKRKQPFAIGQKAGLDFNKHFQIIGHLTRSIGC